MIEAEVTVALATYNGEEYISEQLDSILNQSFKSYKILIADDASTDSTLSILQEYQQKYNNIEVIQNRKQLGLVSNFEKLITLSTTPYIALCDQDDIWYQDKLLKSIESLKEIENKNTPLLFHCDLQVVNENREELYNSFFKMRGYAFSKNRSIDTMLGRCGVMGNTIVMNQALKNRILPFPKNLELHDYWIALVNELFGKRVTLNEPLLEYRVHSNNSSNSSEKLNANMMEQLNSNITLPYHGIKREMVLKELLKRFDLNKKDRVLVEEFIDYLLLKKSKLEMILFIFRYNFFRKGFKYRLKQVGKILLKG